MIIQAATDLNEAPYGSTDFTHSKAFFLGGDNWLAWRQEVADCVGLHGDDLRRAGDRVLRARLIREPYPLAIAASPPRKVTPEVTPKPAPPALTRKTPVTHHRSNQWLAAFLRAS